MTGNCSLSPSPIRRGLSAVAESLPLKEPVVDGVTVSDVDAVGSSAFGASVLRHFAVDDLPGHGGISTIGNLVPEIAANVNIKEDDQR
jgi:hypothetical protein